MKELHNHIFSETACISKETLLRYINNDLTDKEVHQVQKHLIECDFCAEAIEGYEELENPSKIFAIDSKVDLITQKKKPVFNRNLMLAASVLVLLFGAYFSFTLINNVTNEQTNFSVTNNQKEIPLKEHTELLESSKEENYNTSENTTNNQQESIVAEPAPMAPVPQEIKSLDSESAKFMVEDDLDLEMEEAEEIAEPAFFDEVADVEIEAPITSITTAPSYSKTINNNSIITIEKDDAMKQELNKSSIRSLSSVGDIASYKKEERKKDKKLKNNVQSAPATEDEFYNSGNAVGNMDLDKNLESISLELPDIEFNCYSLDTNHLELGIKLYSNKKYDLAIAELDNYINSKTDKLEEAYWYKALCLIELGKIKDAKVYLNQVIKEDKIRKDEANKLLEKLSNF